MGLSRPTDAVFSTCTVSRSVWQHGTRLESLPVFLPPSVLNPRPARVRFVQPATYSSPTRTLTRFRATAQPIFLGTTKNQNPCLHACTSCDESPHSLPPSLSERPQLPPRLDSELSFRGNPRRVRLAQPGGMLRRRLDAPRDGGSGPRIFESEQARDGAASRGCVRSDIGRVGRVGRWSRAKRSRGDGTGRDGREVVKKGEERRGRDDFI